MFSIAYIKQPQHGKGTKWKNQSLKCIIVGTCPHSDSLLFHHPPTKQTFSCGDNYHLNPSTPSGPQFSETFNADFIFNTKSSLEQIHQVPAHENNTTKYYQHPTSNEYTAVTVLNQPVDDSTKPYLVQEKESGDIHEVLAEELREDYPSSTPTAVPSPTLPVPTLPWLHHDAKVTLFLPTTMPHSK